MSVAGTLAGSPFSRCKVGGVLAEWKTAARFLTPWFCFGSVKKKELLDMARQSSCLCGALISTSTTQGKVLS